MNDNNTVTFDKMEDFAAFCFECVKNGMTFQAESDNGTFVVRLTGGY